MNFFSKYLAIFFINVFILLAQPPDTLWTKTFGGSDSDRAWYVEKTIDGGYILAGYTRSFGEGYDDIYIIKTDSLGDMLWTKTYGGLDVDNAYIILQTSDKGYFIAGRTESFGAIGYDVYLVKTDSVGDTLWTKVYGGDRHDEAYSALITNKGNYIVIGSTGRVNYDVLMMMVDSLGDTLWSKTYGGDSLDFGRSVCQTKDGGYIIVGSTKSFGLGERDAYLIKTDSAGDTLWTKVYGGSDNEFIEDVKQKDDGGYIIVGGTYSYGEGGEDVYLLRIDSLGDTLWTKTYGGSEDDRAEEVQVTDDGGFILAGWTRSFGEGMEDIYLLRTDSLGDTLWTKTYGGLLGDGSRCLQLTPDGGYILAGHKRSSESLDDVWLIKMAPDYSFVKEENLRIKNYRLSCNTIEFSNQMIIEYEVSKDNGILDLEVYNILGMRVRAIVHEKKKAGRYLETWNMKDDNGKEVSSGIYFLKLLTEDKDKLVRKFIIVR